MTVLSLTDTKTWVDIISTSVTTVAVLVGAVWAYFKFAKGRTFRPRVRIDLAAQWRTIANAPVLHVRVTLKNMGASQITIVQSGTGLRLALPAPAVQHTRQVQWSEPQETFEVFKDHAWLEPSETITDEQLVDIGQKAELMRLQCRIVLNRRAPFKNIAVMKECVVPIDATLDGDAGAEEENKP